MSEPRIWRANSFESATAVLLNLDAWAADNARIAFRKGENPEDIIGAWVPNDESVWERSSCDVSV
jgi:hypothetical protein